MRPRRFTAPAVSRVSSRLARSPTTTAAPRSRRSRTAASRPLVRTWTTTGCPWSSSVCAAARPRPSAEPVMKTRAIRCPLSQAACPRANPRAADSPCPHLAFTGRSQRRRRLSRMAAPHLEITEVLPRLAIDLVAITVLVYAIYRPRHRRADLVVIYALFNIGLLLAVIVMTAGAVGTGFGFGLFAVLSIVRLRSEPFSNIEMAYFFTGLVLALVCGLDIGNPAINAGLAGVAVAAAALIDLPRPAR